MTVAGGGGKLPGKAPYAGRRRSATRRSGFQVHDDTTGGEFLRVIEHAFVLGPLEQLAVTFELPANSAGTLLGFGVWFLCEDTQVQLSEVPERFTLTEYERAWNKAGSMWLSQDDRVAPVVLKFVAGRRGGKVALHRAQCGVVQHPYLSGAPARLMANMHLFVPEALFISEGSSGTIGLSLPASAAETREIVLKSCNRCGRFLPINVPAERDHLSFSNHCVAYHRRPCRHSAFGRLRNQESDELMELEYGFQLECRFCKKFEVNAAHNPQRTSAQMKEDGARRRAFEFLLAELYGGTPQLQYRHQYNRELADDVWERFGRRCFNCDAELVSINAMHLDHTRPLALLWPLDETATALCKSCNSEKRDRVPSEFYSQERLVRLSELTGIEIAQLQDPGPNDEAIGLLLRKLRWFFEEFLMRDELKKERDGKIAGDLVVKALQKAISKSPNFHTVDLVEELASRRDANYLA